MTNKNYEDMLAGRRHIGSDPYLFDLEATVAKAKAPLDAIPNADIAARQEAMKALFAESSDPAIVLSPFTIQ